jgi:hypothetical protein
MMSSLSRRHSSIGLDECDGENAQQEILALIGQMAAQHSTSPLIWLIVSRPEPHIRGAFAKLSDGIYREITVPIDSNQACKDMELYLRAKFQEIRNHYSSSFTSSMQRWPSEGHFAKIASGARGLFIFAFTVIRFVGDSTYANPISRLEQVIRAINSSFLAPSGTGPFVALDALYTEILSAVPSDLLPTLHRLLDGIDDMESGEPGPRMEGSWTQVMNIQRFHFEKVMS